PITLGPHGHELDLFARAGKIAGDAACLRERELTAPVSYPDHCSGGLEAGPDRGWPEIGATRLRSAVNPATRLRSAVDPPTRLRSTVDPPTRFRPARSLATACFIGFFPGLVRRARGRAPARSVGSRRGRIRGAW